MSQAGQMSFLWPLQTLTGDVGGAVSSLAGNINLLGTAGVITVTGNPVTHTITLSGGASIPTTFHSDAGDATPALNAITIAGGTNIGTTGAGSTITVNLDATITLTTVNATTFDTNVAAAAVTLSGTTLSADGTDANIDINITPKNLGTVKIPSLQVTGFTAGTLRSSGTGVISSLADGANGTLLIGKTGDVPIWATLTDGNNITATEGANSISIAVTGTTQHAVQVGSAAGALTSLAVGGTGVILQGSAGADPAWSTATYPSTVALGDLLCASAANVIGVIGSSTAGYLLTANGAGTAPTFQAMSATIPTTFATDAGSAAPALNSLTVAGGTNINTAGAGSTVTVNLDTSITLTSVLATTFDTNVAAAAVTLTGTTLSADGTDLNIDINITAKGTGKVIIDDLQLTTDLAVTEGGTGVSTLLDHGLLVGSGTAAIDSIAVGGTGVILTGVTGADPTWTTATYPATVAIGDVLVASGANVIGVVTGAATSGYLLTANGAGTAPTFQAPPAGVTYASDAETIAGTVTNKAVAPSNLKAKLGTQTSHGLPYGAGDSSAIVWTAEPSNGQILIGKTGDVPALGTITAGTNITVTNAANSITIASTTVGINDQTDSYQLVAGDAGKLITMTKASANTLTVPKDATVNFAVGTQILVYQGGAGVTTISPEDGTITIRSAGSLVNLFAQYSVCSLVKIAANLWSLSGDLG